MEVFDAHDLLDDNGASLLATSFQEGWAGDKHLLVDKKGEYQRHAVGWQWVCSI